MTSHHPIKATNCQRNYGRRKSAWHKIAQHFHPWRERYLQDIRCGAKSNAGRAIAASSRSPQHPRDPPQNVVFIFRDLAFGVKAIGHHVPHAPGCCGESLNRPGSEHFAHTHFYPVCARFF
jgi:hypothetical protein